MSGRFGMRWIGRIRIWGIALVIFYGAPSGTLIADDISFSPKQEMKVVGGLKEATSFDLTGDGLRDVIVISEVREGEDSRWTASVFVQARPGTFERAPRHVVEIDTLATLLAPVVLPGSRQGVLTFVSPGGLFMLPFDEGRGGPASKKMISVDTPAMTKADEGPLFSDYIRDWDGDGREEVMVHDYSGFSLLSFIEGDSLVRTARISIPPKLSVYHRGGTSELRRDIPVSFRYDFPIVTMGEYDGDGKADLFIRREDDLSVAVQEVSGDYADPVRIRDISKPPAQSEGDEVTVVIGLADFNGDGVTDICETWGKGTGLTGTEAEIRLFLGNAGNGFGRDPDQVIGIKDAIPSLVIFEDLDGDGKDEMIIPTIKLGLMSFVRILTSGVLQIKAQIFDDDPGRVFQGEPRYTHHLSAQIDFSGQSNIVSGHGDFNNDRYIDFVFGTRRNEISVFQGMGGIGNRIYSRDPVLTLSEDSNGFMKSDDLDGNGRDDVLIYYPSSGTVLVYFSID